MKPKRKPCYAAKGLPKVPGKPKGTDIIPAWLTPGEAVLSPGAAEMLGRGNVQALNRKANHMQLGSPQYKAEGEDEMIPAPMDLATLGNQRADQILSNPDMFKPNELRAANRYMDPAGLGGGPSEARDQVFLSNTRSLDSITNPLDDATRQQFTTAQQGLFGGNRQPQRSVGGNDGLSDGMSAAQDAISSALSYGQQAAQEAAQEGQGVAQSAIRDANERARYMSQGGMVPQYFMNGTGMVLGQRPQYYAIGTAQAEDERMRLGRPPAVAQAIQNYPVQQAPQPVMSRGPSFADEIKSAGRQQRPPDTFDAGLQQIGKGARDIVQGYAQGGMNPLNVTKAVPAAKQILGGMGDAISGTYKAAVKAPIEGYAGFGRDYMNAWNGNQGAAPQNNAVTGSNNMLDTVAGLGNPRKGYAAEIANASKAQSQSGPTATGIMNMSKDGSLAPAKEAMTANQDADGNINLNWINEAAKKAAMSLGNQRPNNQASPIDPNGASKAVYMGGMKMPFNQGDFVSYKDSMGILRGGRAGPNGFSHTGMQLGSMMEDPGMKAAIEAQNGMYSANKNMADAGLANAQTANAPAQGLHYLGSAMQNAAMADNYSAGAAKDRDIMANPQKYAKLGGALSRQGGQPAIRDVDGVPYLQTPDGGLVQAPMFTEENFYGGLEAAFPEQFKAMSPEERKKRWANFMRQKMSGVNDPSILQNLNQQPLYQP